MRPLATAYLSPPNAMDIRASLLSRRLQQGCSDELAYSVSRNKPRTPAVEHAEDRERPCQPF